MKYRVAFMERTDAHGNPSENAPDYVELDLMEGVVLDQSLVERLEPESMHGQEVMDEDDSFESIATAVWEYDIADGRDREFLDALKNSQMAYEVEPLEDIDMLERGKA